MGVNPIDKNLISSSHINFLFGAGVNGQAFPQLKGFVKSLKLLSQKLGHEVEDFEGGVNELSKKDREEVYGKFKEEFQNFDKNIDFTNSSLENLKVLFKEIFEIVEQSENRQKDMKQINVYTLNYDTIPDRLLTSLGFTNNSVSANTINTNLQFLDMVSYNLKLKKFVPTFVISRLHGDINQPVFPGNNKYEESLASEHFEITYKMKEQLCKYNSVLFVIGYSCNDEHINKILKDCMNHGLVIYWFKYDETNKVLETDFQNQLCIIEQKDSNKPEDTTKRCADLLRECHE